MKPLANHDGQKISPLRGSFVEVAVVTKVTKKNIETNHERKKFTKQKITKEKNKLTRPVTNNDVKKETKVDQA